MVLTNQKLEMWNGQYKGGDKLTTQINVKVFNNNVEKAIRVLKKKMLKEGIIKELKQRRYYEKPSEMRLREQKENIRRWRKAQRRRMERE